MTKSRQKLDGKLKSFTFQWPFPKGQSPIPEEHGWSKQYQSHWTEETEVEFGKATNSWSGGGGGESQSLIEKGLESVNKPLKSLTPS